MGRAAMDETHPHPLYELMRLLWRAYLIPIRCQGLNDNAFRYLALWTLWSRPYRFNRVDSDVPVFVSLGHPSGKRQNR